MRVTEDMIEKRLAETLKAAGFNVVAGEVKEGFAKPALFVDCYPAKVTLLNADTEEVTDNIQITYVPRTETVEQCAKAARVLRDALMYKTFDVGDRRFTFDGIEFETVNYILYCGIELTYIQETPGEEYEKIETLKIGGDIYGTSVN